MAVNPTISQLDTSQIVKRVFDSTNDAYRVAVTDATSFAIELSADDGDSVTSRPESSTSSGTADNTTAVNAVIITEASAVGIKSVALYSKSTTAIVGPQVCTLQVSPADSGDVWVDTATTVTPSTTLDAVVISAIGSIVARRMRVKAAGATTSGSATIYLVAQAS